MTRTPSLIAILMLVATTVDAQPATPRVALWPAPEILSANAGGPASPAPGSIAAPATDAAWCVPSSRGRGLWTGGRGPSARVPSRFGPHGAAWQTVASELSLDVAGAVRPTHLWVSDSTRKAANVDWMGLVTEQIRIDAVMHMKRVTEAKTQKELIPGNSDDEDFRKWVRGYREGLDGYVSTPARWADGDGFVTNNLSHPLMGGIYSYAYTNNDARCKDVGYGGRSYWSCIGRAAVYATAASINWEWNPLMSETAIGHVGKAYRCGNGRCVGEGGFTDFVMTPAGGMALRIAGDIAQAKLWPVLDRHLSGGTAARIANVALKVLSAPAHSANCALNLDFKGMTTSHRSARRR